MDNRTINQDYLEAFIPGLLLDWYRKNENRYHRISRHEGLICFIDVSGFTTLTRKITGSTKEGPELLTEILNRFFEVLSDEAGRSNGDIIKFAGDAVWIYFPEIPDPGKIFAKVRKRVKQINQEFAILKEFPLDIHAGAEWGEFNLVSFGNPDIRLEPEPLGEVVTTAMTAAEHAEQGELLAGPELAGKLPGDEVSADANKGFFRIKISDSATEQINEPALITDNTRIQQDYLRPYLAQSLLNRILDTSSEPTIQSEFRKVAVLFVAFEFRQTETGELTEKNIEGLNNIVVSIFDIIQSQGGAISRIDPYGKGHKLLVLFGAPVRGSDDELRALQTALKLSELSTGHFRIRSGLAEGPLFCGEVGTSRRKEYTVMGESVNLSARLMNAAGWGQVFFDEELRRLLPDNVISTELSLDLKGYRQNLGVHKLSGISDRTEESYSPFRLAGRKKDLEHLRDYIERVRDNKRPSLCIQGDTGVGKSSLLRHFLKEVDDFNILSINCRHSLLFGHAWLIRKIISELYQNNPDHKRVPLKEFIKARIGTSWWPLLAEMIGIESEDNSWTRGLTPELKTEKGRELFAMLIETLVNQPQVIAIDDFDRADEYSRNMMAAISRVTESTPLLFLTTVTNSPGDDDFHDEIVILETPSNNEWWEFFSDSFVDGKREREMIEDLLHRSQGNPSFIVEFIRRGMSEGVFHTNRINGRLELREANVVPQVPEKMEEIQMARFDSLSEDRREFLKKAAAFHTEFSIDMISSVFDDKTISEVIPKKLAAENVLTHDSEKNRYDFLHDSMRQVIYECVPKRTLREWHRSIAEYLEEDNENPSLIAFHLYRAEKWEKAFSRYLDAAGIAIAGFSLNSAYDYLGKCRKLLNHEQSGEIHTEDKYRFYRYITELFIIDGRFNEAYPDFRAWRKTAEKEDDREEFLTAVAEAGALMRKQAKYKACRKMMNYLLVQSDIDLVPEVKSKTYSVLGELERRAGNFEQAGQYCLKAAAISERAGDHQGLADAWNNLGLALWGGGNLKEAAEHFRKSLERAEEYYGKYSLAQSSNNLAIIYWEQGDFIAADDMLSRAHGIFRNIGDRRNEAYAAGNLSSIHRISGKLKSARHLLMQADLVFERLEDTHAHHYVIGNIGDIDLIEGKLENAERFYRTASDFADQIGDPELRAECEIRFGDLAFFRNAPNLAKGTYLRAEEMADSIGSSEYSLRSKVGLARLHILSRENEKALELIGQIKKKATADKLVLLANEADFLLGEQARIEGNRAKAVRFFRKVIKYAVDQRIFELILKCSVRIYELSSQDRKSAEKQIKNLADYLTMENSPAVWQTIVNSAYFYHFKETLERFEGPIHS